MISAESNGFNPIQQQKLRNAIEASKEGGEPNRSSSTMSPPATPSNKTPVPPRKASGDTGIIVLVCLLIFVWLFIRSSLL